MTNTKPISQTYSKLSTTEQANLLGTFYSLIDGEANKRKGKKGHDDASVSTPVSVPAPAQPSNDKMDCGCRSKKKRSCEGVLPSSDGVSSGSDTENPKGSQGATTSNPTSTDDEKKAAEERRIRTEAQPFVSSDRDN